MENLDDTFGEWNTGEDESHCVGLMSGVGNDFQGLGSTSSTVAGDSAMTTPSHSSEAPGHILVVKATALPTAGSAVSMRSSAALDARRRSGCESVDLEAAGGNSPPAGLSSSKEGLDLTAGDGGERKLANTQEQPQLLAEGVDEFDDPEKQALHDNGVLAVASNHSRRAFMSCDVPLCTPTTASFLLAPTGDMTTYRGSATLTPKGKIQHPVDHPSMDYPHYILPPTFPPEMDGRVGTLRFFSIYADLPEEAIASLVAPGDCIVKNMRSATKASPDSGAVVCKVERTVFHPVTQGCMKRSGIVVLRNTGDGFQGATSATTHGCQDAKNWTLWWGQRFKDQRQFSTLLPFQKVNHFPRTWLLGRKDHLARGIQKAGKRVAKTENAGAFSFIPQTYSMPIDAAILKNDCRASGTIFICKPPASAQGKGIFLFSDRVPKEILEPPVRKEKKKEKAVRKLRPAEVRAGALGRSNQNNRPNRDDSDSDYDSTSSDSDSNSDSDDEEDEPCIVQRYLTNPFLINGFKSDLRIYVLVTSYEPLTIYVFNDGLVRFATEKYDLSDIDKVYSHLTNYSLNKQNTGAFQKADDDGSGSKWTLNALKRYIIEQHPEGGQDVWDRTWNKVHDVIIKTLISAESAIAPEVSSLAKHAKSCFEMYGFDIMLTTDLDAILVEVNVLPSLACAAALDKHVKGHMIADMLTLVGIPCQTPGNATNNSPSSATVKAGGTAIPGTGGATTAGGGGKENQPPPAAPVERGNNIRIKSCKNTNEVLEALKRPKQKYIDFFSGSLITEDDKAMIRESEEEFRRHGGWTRVFPTPESGQKFGPLFEKDKKFNWLMWRWEEEKRRFSPAERHQAFEWLCGRAPYPAPIAPPVTVVPRRSMPRGPSAVRSRSGSVGAGSRVTAEPKHVTQRVRRPASPPKASLRTTTFQFVQVPKQQ